METFKSYINSKKKLLDNIQTLPDSDQEKIKYAILTAEKFHSGQKRDEGNYDGMGYVIHCVRTALWLTEQKINNASIIIATILHDTLEDTILTTDEIKNRFGDDVLNLVLSVTRPRPDNETEEEKIKSKSAHFEKILNCNEKTRLIKTADFLDNMRSWPFIPKNHLSQMKFPRWIQEAKTYYLPIATSVSRSAAEEMKKIINTTKLQPT